MNELSSLLGFRIDTPEATVAALRGAGLQPGRRALLWTNVSSRVLDVQLIETPDDALSPAHARECLTGALRGAAVGCVLVCHTAASAAEPEFLDRHVKAQIQQALRVIDVRLIDHLIFNAGKHYSTAWHGDL